MTQTAKYQQLRLRGWERAKTFHWSRVSPRACDGLKARREQVPVKLRSHAHAAGGAIDELCAL